MDPVGCDEASASLENLARGWVVLAESSIQLQGWKQKGLHTGPCGQRQKTLYLLPAMPRARAERILTSLSLGVGGWALRGGA